MDKLRNLELLDIEELSYEDEIAINGGGFAHFVGWVVGGAICGTKCIANYLGINEPGKW